MVSNQMEKKKISGNKKVKAAVNVIVLVFSKRSGNKTVYKSQTLSLYGTFLCGMRGSWETGLGARHRHLVNLQYVWRRG